MPSLLGQTGLARVLPTPRPAGSAKLLAAQGGAPLGASAQEAWEGDRLEPALVWRGTHRLGELAPGSAPCPENGAADGTRDPPAAARLTQVPAQMSPLRVQPFGQRTWRCHLMRCHLMP